MRRINKRTVEYSDQEMPIVIAFEAALDAGRGIKDAAWLAIESTTLGKRRIWLEPAFVSHLSERTLRYDRITDRIEETTCQP